MVSKLVKVSESAKKELKRMIDGRTLEPGKFLRLATPPVWTLEGDFGVVVDDERFADQVVFFEGEKLLLVDPELAKHLANAAFDFKSTPEGVRFTLDVY